MHHAQVLAVLRLADIVQAMDMSTYQVETIGHQVTQGTSVGPDMAAMLYAAALVAAQKLLGRTDEISARDLNDLVLDELADRDEKCDCADEVSLLRQQCGTHDR